MLAVRRVAGPPQMLQAGSIVGELGQELGDRVVRLRGLGPLRFVAVCWRHGVKILDRPVFVKSVDRLEAEHGNKVLPMRQIQGWIRANGGPPAVVVLGMAIAAAVSGPVGIALIAVGAIWFAVWLEPVRKRLIRFLESPDKDSGDEGQGRQQARGDQYIFEHGSFPTVHIHLAPEKEEQTGLSPPNDGPS